MGIQSGVAVLNRPSRPMTLPRRQVHLPPPRDVGRVAERAHHRDAGALLRVGERVADDGHLDLEHGGAHRRPEQPAEALVAGVRHQRHAADHELRACRVDQDRAVGAVEGEQVVGTWTLAVLDLRLGDGRAVVDVPERGGLGAVGLPATEVAQEGELAGPAADVVDRRVEQRPVERQTEAPERLLEHGLVGGGQLVAQLDEVGPRDRDFLMTARCVAAVWRLEVGVVVLGRVAAHAEVVLHAPLGGEPVVVPADRVVDDLAAHPLVADDAVGVGVAEDVAHVDRARHRGWWSVDHEHAGAVANVERVSVEPVDTVGLPALGPARLDAIQRRFVRDPRHQSNATSDGFEPCR